MDLQLILYFYTVNKRYRMKKAAVVFSILIFIVQSARVQILPYANFNVTGLSLDTFNVNKYLIYKLLADSTDSIV